jgi:parvulin-like peptidyl-prolyl isomerase
MKAVACERSAGMTLACPCWWTRQTRAGCRHARATMLALAALCTVVSAEPDEDLRRALSLLDAKEKAALAADPALLKQVVQLTHAQQLLLREARAANWHERPEVKAKLERARDTALAESWLQSIAEPPPDYPGEAELKAAYEARKTSLSRPRQYRLAQIFIACPKGSPAAAEHKAKAKLAAVQKRLDSPTEDFATVATAESEDPASAGRGGEIGWLSDAQIQPELRAPIVRLRKHGISDAVRLNDGWHILKCLDKREAHTPAYEDARPALIQELRAAKTKADSEAHVARLLEANPLKMDDQFPGRILDSDAPAAEK